MFVASSAVAEVRIVAIDPARTEATLRCTVVSTGMPDAPSRETLASGLPSSLVLSLAVLDPRGRVRGGTRAEVRIEPDPWERSYVVRWPGAERRANSMDEVAGILARLGPFTVATLGGVEARGPLRIRARLTVHALAPAEADQARALVSGETGGGGSERREVSAGLGSLLRFFLGRTPADSWNSEAMSAPFDVRAIASEP